VAPVVVVLELLEFQTLQAIKDQVQLVELELAIQLLVLL
jgi:hypothetical protein